MKRMIPALVSALLALTVAGCAGGGNDGGAVTPTPAPTSSGGLAPDPTPAPDGGPTRGAGWRTTPLTVRHDVAVPPVPVLTGIRYARHPEEGFDRVVFDISGAPPGYDVRYVDQPVADGSGDPVSVPGRRFIQIRFEPADAHDATGGSTVGRAATLGYPMLQGYAVTGDFEAVVTVVLGLDDVVAFRVGELPGRVYVDVAA
jgi:hypothetical protein